METDHVPSPSEVLLVLVTVPDAEVGARLGRTLVEERLAACVNVVPGLRSIYAWRGAVCDEREALCLIKTRRTLYSALRTRVEALHPYELPEIVGVPLGDGNSAYLAWVFSGTATP